MDKRYQVFVSSTFADLKEERQNVTQTLLEMNCIPIGMELFPAVDDQQLEFIKKIIDDCDYYVLIIGGRYGSLAADGTSYTEKEYEYALERDIEVLAFLHENPDEIPDGKSESDPEQVAKLQAFRDRVESGPHVQYWKTADELPGMVALSLTKTIRIEPAEGWVRASYVASNEILAEAIRFRRENDELKEKIAKLEAEHHE